MRNVAIIGRRDEIGTLESFVSRLPDGFHALFLEGEAGVGKTTLWEAAVDRAHAAGDRVLAARATESEAKLAYAGLADLLAGLNEEEILDAVPAIQRRALEAVLLLGDAPAEVDERVVGAATRSALRVLAERGPPVCIAVDDLQWLDVPSVHALEFALRRFRDEPVGFLAAMRVEHGAGSYPPLLRSLGTEHVQRLSIGPLSAGALYELIRLRLGIGVSRPALLRLHDLSGGNPFFALELARASVERPDVPRDLRELLRARIAALSTGAADVVFTAAALRNPSVDLIERVLPQADVIAALQEAAGLAIAELDSGRVRFVHPLLASTAYTDASPRRRRELHRCLAAAVAQPEECARHLALSAEAPDEAIASALEAAAKDVAARGSLVAAAELAGSAVELTPVGEHRPLQRRRLAAARFCFAAGDTAQARTLLAAAEAEADPGAERAQILHELSRIARAADDLRVAHELARRAAGEAAEDSRLRAEILASAVNLTGYWGDGYRAALADAEEAIELAEASGDEITHARALAARAEVEHSLGERYDAELFARAERMAERAGAPSVAREIAYKSCELAIDEGELDGVRDRLEALCTDASQRGDAWASVPLLRLAVLDYETGDWSRALEAVDELERMTTQTGWNVNMALAHAMRALVEGMRGDIESARTRAVAALDETEQRGRLSRFPLTVLATLAMSVEDYAEAYEQLERVLARNRARDVRDPKSLCSGAEALVGLNRLQEAGALLAECEAAGPHGRPAEAAYSRARGLLAAEQGDLERGEAELAASVAGWRELDLPLELGRSLLALGSVRRRARKKRDAREALDEASELFERIGARIWAKRARVEAARIGGRVAPRTGLTGTEDAIAALVATGKSNREVAAALRLSTHTVEWNLARIYRKLGIHSRTQLAAARAKR